MTVEELRVLAFLPLPDEDVIEGVVDVVLDDDEELLVPVPVDPHPPPRLVEGAGGVSQLQVPRPRVLSSAVKRSIGSTTGCTITEKAPIRAFSWLKAATTAFTFKTLLRHYAKKVLTPRSLTVKFGPF